MDVVRRRDHELVAYERFFNFTHYGFCREKTNGQHTPASQKDAENSPTAPICPALNTTAAILNIRPQTETNLAAEGEPKE